ncbi:sugar (pentulose or hexulose) kinase [Bradyrhizobium sp. USDA 4486]
MPGTPFATIDAEIASTLGISSSARIGAGTTDGVAAFITTRADTPGDAVTSLGTTLVVKLLATQPIFAPGQVVYSHRLGERWLAGGASNSGGGALLTHFTAEDMERLTPLLRPGEPTGLDYYPLPNPESVFRLPIRRWPHGPRRARAKTAFSSRPCSRASRRSRRSRTSNWPGSERRHSAASSASAVARKMMHGPRSGIAVSAFP